MSCLYSAHLFAFDLFVLITFAKRANYAAISLYSFLYLTATSSFFYAYTVLSTLFLNMLKLCFSLKVKNQVLHSHRKKYNSILYILTLKCLDGTRENKTFWSA
jgi:hypothetical protein